MAPALPHASVLTRLGVSAIHGIGVFAIRPIARGTTLFPDDQREIVWIDAAILDSGALTPAEKQLYEDFCIRRGAELGCPASFDLLGTGWYLNHAPSAEAANVVATADYAMVTARDIAEGEELTVRYETFSRADRPDQAALSMPSSPSLR